MTGHDAFKQMVAFGNRKEQIHEPVTLEAFEQWRQNFTFEGLRGQRYGQSFCNHFGISDNLLYYTYWPTDQIDDYIQRYYLART
jgi:tagatose-1,6-bisphosphate aldolase non-catalytic subunit AgaZ/GatZ